MKLILGDNKILLPTIVGILILGTLGFTPFAFAGVFVDTVTIDGTDTQGDCENMVPLGLEGTFDGTTCTLLVPLDVQIEIIVDNFTLDCDNQIIQSLVEDQGIGIAVIGSTNVEITNCIINDFQENIRLENSNENRIIGNIVNDAGARGISLVNSNENNIFDNRGIENDFLIGIANSDNNDVQFNSMNDGQNGMEMSNSNGNTIKENGISDNDTTGFFISGGTNNKIIDNNFIGNNEFGLKLENSNGNQIIENEFKFNVGDGIKLLNSNENQIMGNLIDGNFGDINDGRLGAGLLIQDSELNTISGNNISNNLENGIDLFFSSDNIIINNNFVNNPNQILDDSGVNNQFDQPSPVFGNYYDSFDVPGEGCNDVVAPNGICDDPFVFSGGQDNSPWTKADGWLDVVSPVDKIEELIAEVDKLDLNAGNKNALTKKLVNAIKNITNEDPTDDAEACEKLQAFINQLNAKVKSDKLDSSDVEEMIDSASNLIDELCSDP